MLENMASKPIKLKPDEVKALAEARKKYGLDTTMVANALSLRYREVDSRKLNGRISLKKEEIAILYELLNRDSLVGFLQDYCKITIPESSFVSEEKVFTFQAKTIDESWDHLYLSYMGRLKEIILDQSVEKRFDLVRDLEDLVKKYLP